MQPKLNPDVLYESAGVLVINKPAGLLSQGDASGAESVVDWARKRHAMHWVGLIHRLDRNTSGALVLGKTEAAARALTQQLQDGKLSRIYLGWVRGSIREAVVLEDLLFKDVAKNTVRVVLPASPVAAQASLARLQLTPVRQGSWMGAPMTLCEFQLETGRSHQIRVQTAHAGHPILGDAKYGGVKAFEPDFGRPALHSWKVCFVDPTTRETHTIEAPAPGEFTF